VAAPEYARPVLIRDSASSAGFAYLFRSHSAASVLSVSLDFLTVFLASAIAARFRPRARHASSPLFAALVRPLPDLLHALLRPLPPVAVVVAGTGS
jgi:hypothetical protein